MHDPTLRRIGAVDIGGSKVAVAAVREDGRMLTRRQCPTLPERGFADAIARIEKMLHEVSDECGALDGIGVGCPGPLDPFSGTVLQVGTLPGWSGGELALELQSRFGVRVAVENDADAAALAEFHWGGARGSEKLHLRRGQHGHRWRHRAREASCIAVSPERTRSLVTR